jgi:hypothetical protein
LGRLTLLLTQDGAALAAPKLPEDAAKWQFNQPTTQN